MSGTIPDQSGGFGALAFTEEGIQNGDPDGLALVDASENVLQFLTYGGEHLYYSSTAVLLDTQQCER